MDTLLHFLSNYTNVWIVNAVLIVAFVAIAVLRFRDKRIDDQQLRDAYAAGHAVASTARIDELRRAARAALEGYPKLVETWGTREQPDRYGPAEIQRTKQVIAACWRGGASVDECAQLAQVETDYACMVLADCGLLPGDVLETIENPMAQVDHETSKVIDFDEHVSVYEQWREPQPGDGPEYHAEYQFWLDNRHKVKAKDVRTPMQLIRQDTAGYMD